MRTGSSAYSPCNMWHKSYFTLSLSILQEAVDSEGRQRFHGAFTGGWSAGHYNSVGSAEGWAPSAFRSSRSDRASAK